MAKRNKNTPTTPVNNKLYKILIILILMVAFLTFVIRSTGNYTYFSSMSEEDGRSLKEQDSFWDHLNKRKVDKVGANYSFDYFSEVGCKSINLYLDDDSPGPYAIHRPYDEKYALYDEYGVNEVTYYQYPWNATSRVDKNSDNDSFEIWIDLDNKLNDDYDNFESEDISFEVSKRNFSITSHYISRDEFWLTEEQQYELMNFAIDQFKEYQKEYFKVNK